MLLSEGIVEACRRWLHLLRTSTSEQAIALLRADSRYTDLSTTQYFLALEWLKGAGLVVANSYGYSLPAEMSRFTQHQLDSSLFVSGLEAAEPPWLADADLLVADASGIPSDALRLAAQLELSDDQALLSIRQVYGKIDLEKRRAVGNAGELALFRLLNRQWPGSTQHVAADHDGLGYDLILDIHGESYHLEVKSTTRRGRLRVYLSRHEFEVGRLDSHWRLVIAGLNEANHLVALAVADTPSILSMSPRDIISTASWQSVRLDLTSTELSAGLTLVGESGAVGLDPLLAYGHQVDSVDFAWFPDL